jgi:type I restriction enzyme, S subunit
MASKPKQVDYLKLPEPLKVPAFSVDYNDIQNRFDASYYVPEVQGLLGQLKRSGLPMSTIGVEAEIIIPPRFKRIFVSEQNGIRYIRPSDMVTLRPLEDKFLSKRTQFLESLRLNEGEVLISTDGAVGRLSYVTKMMDGWAGSNNIGRIRVGVNLHPGYLLAFLASPFGQYQLKREIYGGVIDHLEVSHISGVVIPLPTLEVQKEVGEKIIYAYELRSQGVKAEDEAYNLLNKLIKSI